MKIFFHHIWATDLNFTFHTRFAFFTLIIHDTGIIANRHASGADFMKGWIKRVNKALSGGLCHAK